MSNYFINKIHIDNLYTLKNTIMKMDVCLNIGYKITKQDSKYSQTSNYVKFL